jgi:hypothetical protein
MIAEAIYRRFFPMKNGRAQDDLRLTHLESLAVAQVESEALEMTRSGRRFTGVFSTTGIAPVQAVPTTAAAWALYNGDPAKSYVIDNINGALLSGTAGVGGAFLCIVAPLNAAVAAAAGSAVGSRSGSNMSSKAVLGINYTLSALSTNVQWGFVEAVVSPSAALGAGSGGITADVHGRIIVPPGKVLGISLVAPAGTTPLYLAGVTWHEVELDLE